MVANCSQIVTGVGAVSRRNRIRRSGHRKHVPSHRAIAPGPARLFDRIRSEAENSPSAMVGRYQGRSPRRDFQQSWHPAWTTLKLRLYPAASLAVPTSILENSASISASNAPFDFLNRNIGRSHRETVAWPRCQFLAQMPNQLRLLIRRKRIRSFFDLGQGRHCRESIAFRQETCKALVETGPAQAA